MVGTGTHAILLGVWEELRAAIGAWLDVRARPASQQSAALQVIRFSLCALLLTTRCCLLLRLQARGTGIDDES